jgi:hypothetical protein
MNYQDPMKRPKCFLFSTTLWACYLVLHIVVVLAWSLKDA